MEINNNSGRVFRNKNKITDKSPDWNGTVNIEGRLYQIALWEKVDKYDQEFYGVSFRDVIEMVAAHES